MKKDEEKEKEESKEDERHGNHLHLKRGDSDKKNVLPVTMQGGINQESVVEEESATAILMEIFAVFFLHTKPAQFS